MVGSGHVLTVIFVVTAILGGCVGQPKCRSSECVSDAKITTSVEAQLNQHGDLGPPNLISVQTREGVVYLSGSGSAGEQSRTAESLVAGLPGVERIVNTIAVTK